MSQKLNSAIAVIGIDIGKNSFHIVGHDQQGLTSRFAPPTDILRTKQSIPEPSNEIVPAFMTFWRWVSRSWPIRTPFRQSVQNFPE
jgi:hypothetical protein